MVAQAWTYSGHPDVIGASAAYPKKYAESIKNEYTFASPFPDGEDIVLWWEDEDYIYLPRGLALPRKGCEEKYDEGISVNFDLDFTPRYQDQTRVIDEIVDYLKDGKSHVACAATGFGKTVCAMAVIAKIQKRTLVIATKEDIVSQWVEAAKKFLKLTDTEISIWRGNKKPDPNAKLVISLIQSVAKGPERYGKEAYQGFGLVIVDECHRIAAEFFSHAMRHLPARLRLGLSATPERKDGRTMVITSHIGPILVTGKVQTLIPKIIIAKTQWKVPTYNYGERAGQKVDHTPGKTSHLNKHLAACQSRNYTIAKFVQTCLSKGRHCIVFADTLAHLEAVHQAIRALGVPEERFGWYVGTQSLTGTKKERLEAREAAKLKPIIMATYAMASEATDIPWLDSAVLASPRSDVVQIVGRIRREYPNKKLPVVLDLIDEDSYVYSLYARKRIKWYQELGAEIAWK